VIANAPVAVATGAGIGRSPWREGTTVSQGEAEDKVDEGMPLVVSSPIQHPLHQTQERRLC
jgi:hypothetical protein